MREMYKLVSFEKGDLMVRLQFMSIVRYHYMNYIVKMHTEFYVK